MDLGSIFVILSLLILVGLFIGRPFLEQRYGRPGSEYPAVSEQEVSTLLAERDRIVNALRELDFDHTVGKIPEGDYPAQRSLLLQQGVEILRQLDAQQVGASQPGLVDGSTMQPERAGTHPAVPAPVVPSQAGTESMESDEELEALIVARRRAHQQKASGFCHRCGKPVRGSDRFCPKCGAVLNAN